MSAKRIILMYISEISGHHSATLAIEKSIRALEPAADIMNINAFNYTSPITEKIVNHLYMSVIKRTPKVWDYLYDNPVVVKKLEKLKKGIHKFNSPKLKALFDKFRPDAVACTQAYPCGMCADYKKEYGAPVKLTAVLTDYVPHAYWVYDTVDYYITPSEYVSARLEKKGVPAGKIRAYGIPFDPEFNQPIDERAVMRKFSLTPEFPVLLMMGGGHGLGPMAAIVQSLEKVRQPLQEIIVSGNNKKLYRSLRKATAGSRHKIVLFEYVDFVHELMRIADIIITKPGGVTTAESLARKLPMIIVRPIPGQEASNAAYLTEHHAALRIDDPHQIHRLIEDLLAHPDRLGRLRECAGRIGKPNAGFDIARLLLGYA